MNKKGIATPILLLLLVSGTTAVATGAAVASTRYPEIIPGSPFYGLKEYGRTVEGLFAMNKTAYEYQVLEQKQLEIKEMEKLQLNNTMEYTNLQNEIQIRQQQLEGNGQ